MAFIDAGFDGTVDEVQFANLLNRYAVVGADDFKASNVAGADRTLSIADGTALGPGTLNVGTGFSPIQFDAVTSGTTRWDLVVLRRDWQPPGGNTSIVIIKGGATKVLPTAGTATTSWNRRPGIIDDQPLYLQQVNAGSTSLGARVDLRVWQGPGGTEAADQLALTYLALPGAAVKIGGTVHRYELQGNGVWGWSTPYEEYNPVVAAGYSSDGKINIERVGDKRRVTLNFQVRRTGSSFTLGTSYANLGAIIPARARGAAAGIYLPVAMSGAAQNILDMIFINPSSGVVLIRAVEQSHTWLTDSLFTVNCTYYI